MHDALCLIFIVVAGAAKPHTAPPRAGGHHVHIHGAHQRPHHHALHHREHVFTQLHFYADTTELKAFKELIHKQTNCHADRAVSAESGRQVNNIAVHRLLSARI